MQKTILITGSTDGIGLETAKMLIAEGHKVLVHGRNKTKLERVAGELSRFGGAGSVESYVSDLSIMAEVVRLAAEVAEKHDSLDVLINNAGVYRVSATASPDTLDVRFAVNTIAPYLLTKKLLPLLGGSGRVVNLSSAAQAPLNPQDLNGVSAHNDGMAYAQSKLALTMWSAAMADSLGADGPVVVAVNPASMLGSKMVKEAYGVDGADLRIGADILRRAALSDEFAAASGKYFDNDSGRFSSPHPDASNPQKCAEVVSVIENVLARFSN
ncbi:SDR family NAD(P)-dependent oxidoreductase [Desulfovibrio sp. JC022]|uniref:SDR family NAD(P)-dependent oxidoreductase n=1 Tax=Desulfovibrio sp. JC022 TaxID=2593642 RepID=UPI0013D3DB74|nr:SDR family NAD(P)-dependent oxidoreductase [Desulfovibrio sp. JC022]NDV24745.1 SDR family NAD(P)-dependent oxidoreductase [Desulfovibrio sp. JC022]